MGSDRRPLALRAHIWVHERLAATRRGARYLAPGYDYPFSPEQLWTLCDALDQVASVPGEIVEVGCARGGTAVYLNRHLDSRGQQRTYRCIDTFAGFTEADVAGERRRGKTHRYADFDFNSPALFAATMAANGLSERVVLTPADARTLDYARLPEIAFALVDVDLYAPMLAALKGVWSRLAPGGVLIADDCLDNNMWDGALQAYTEMCKEVGAEPEIVAVKLGVLRKPKLD